MAIVDLIMPKLGESIMEATILKWHKKPGDTVKMDETVLEIATDKVDSEVPSTAAGTITEILYNVNDVVPVGAAIARIETEVAASAPATNPAPAPVEKKPEPVLVEAEEIPYTPKHTVSANGNGGANRFYSPLVLNIASSEGIGLGELESISGTGNEGRVTKKDILDQAIIEYEKRPVGGQQAGIFIPKVKVFHPDIDLTIEVGELRSTIDRVNLAKTLYEIALSELLPWLE